ncbi:MAG: tRNA (adenosine(37)-N6)-threonylcarbamoyltransferase complex dimerization subunit type 1 TsaB [Phycisphaerales bacterium]
MAAGALTLAIETSNPPVQGGGSVALGRVGDHMELLGERSLAPEGRHDDALMPAIDALCREHRVAARALKRVCASAGPGGYTAVRIGVTTAKMIAEASGAVCVGVPTACVAAHDAFGRLGVEAVIVTLAWKRGLGWSGVVRAAAPGVVERVGVRDAPGLATLMRESGVGVCLGDAHLPEAARDAVAATGGRIEALRLSAGACLAASRWFGGADPARVTPIYPREPEAVRVWRART